MPNLEVLTSLDKAKTQWYHFTAIVIAGMGFFTDAYDLFSIPTVTGLLGRLYYQVPGASTPTKLPVNVNAAVNGVALCGTLAGQLFFGWLGDKLGRKRVYGMTLLLMVLAALACGLSLGHTATSVMTTLCFFRFWLGFGIGGDYPLSATIMSEYANTRTRGAFIAAVFAMQGTGILVAGAVGCIVSAIYNNSVQAPPFDVNAAASCPQSADFVWRAILMFGAIPALATFYFRMKMPETARFTALVEGNQKQAALDMAKVLQMDEIAASEPAIYKTKRIQYGLFSREFFRRHGRHLLGTTTCWFLLDAAFYSQTLFQKNIYSAVGWIPAAAKMSAVEEVFKTSRAQTLIALCSTVPGYWVTVALIDIIGRFTIQLQGFFFMTVFMLALTIPYDHLSKHDKIGFVVLYALTFFFSNFGPNSTTFIVPAEVFPARVRSTCHGISAACGKAGAIVGTFGFLYASQSSHQSEVQPGYKKGIGLRNSLFLLCGTNALGFFFTFLVPETNQRSLEDCSGENEENARFEAEDKAAAANGAQQL
jgi:PHS family inorganic phosphate transporter-like MFS transporter